jgi:hypothetical protein
MRLRRLLLIAAFKLEIFFGNRQEKSCKLICRKVTMSEHFFDLTSMSQHVKS